MLWTSRFFAVKILETISAHEGASSGPDIIIKYLHEIRGKVGSPAWMLLTHEFVAASVFIIAKSKKKSMCES